MTEAKYTYKNEGIILKDGHTMFPVDVIKDIRHLQRIARESVPIEKVQVVIDEIKAEIRRRAGHTNIGKIGCVRRLQTLITKDGENNG
jgi:hypothetical protein